MSLPRHHLARAVHQGTRALFWSHCLFTVPAVAHHAMGAEITLETDADLTYQEVHYHGFSGGIEVIPRAHIRLGERARYHADFTLTQGRVGKLDIDYHIDAGKGSVTELTSRVFGRVTD